MTAWAFLDESGEPNLNLEKGGSTHFAIAAVVVPGIDLPRTREAVESVRARYFQTGPIKSKKVARNLTRRLEILRALSETGVRILGLVVDKRRLDRDSGLRFRQSFMKYLYRFLYERLFRAYPVLHIRADRHGRPEFMASFEAYLQRHCEQTELFATLPEIEFVDSDSEVLVQAADFFAGSLRIAYGDETGEDDARAILSTLRPASLGVQEWPPSVRTQSVLPIAAENDDLDSLVRAAAERSAYSFMADTQEHNDELTRMQVEVLQDFFRALRFENCEHISSDALAENLRERGYSDCSRDTVRRNVIAPMRDREVLIVSSAKGYGLASSLSDVETHVKRMEDEVRPILKRVQILDAQLKLMSLGAVDLLQREQFRYLREMIDHHQELQGRA